MRSMYLVSNTRESLLFRYLSVVVTGNSPIRTTDANVWEDNKGVQVKINPSNPNDPISYQEVEAAGFKLSNLTDDVLGDTSQFWIASSGKQRAIQALYDMTVKLEKRRILVSEVSTIRNV